MQKNKNSNNIIKKDILQQYFNSSNAIFFFYIRKTTTCVVLGDEYIDGNFGCGVLQVVKGVIIHCKFSQSILTYLVTFTSSITQFSSPFEIELIIGLF